MVEFGEPANPITSRNYWFNVVLDLKTGANLVDVNLTAPTSQWAFHQGGLAIGAGPVGMSAVGIITFTLRTTAGEDLFDVFDTPDLWNIFIDGRGGNDQLRMGTSTDLDNSFDNSIFYFIGGSGDDTITLSDVGDELGDNDDFTIGATVGFVGDFPISHGSLEKQNLAGGGAANLLAYHSVDKLVLQLDNDPNRVFYDLSGLTTVEIFGNGGSDSFINRAVGTSLPDSFSTSLAQFVTFHGGAGTDNLSLVDNDGGPGSYEINSGQFFYIPTITTSTVNFESFATVEIIGSDGANGVTVRARPSGATLNIASGEGDDTFTIGGGDLDSNGFFNSGITLSAGTGNDSIVFDDHLDRDAVGETENYTFGNLSLAKGALILVYSTFENQTLLAANGVNVGQINTVPSVNLNAISGFLDSTTIVGGPARGCTVNVGNGNLINLSGIVNVNLSGDSSDRITVSDQLSTGTTSSYEVNNSQVRKTSTGQTINYSGVTQIVLNTRDSVSVSDAINVRSVPAGTAVIVNANAGNDHLFLGGGNLGAFILGPVIFNGATGIDDVNFSNSLDAILSTHTLTSTTFTDGIIHTYTGMDLLRFDAGPGGSILNVNSLATAAEITGGSGDDAISIGDGSLANGLGSNMTIAGGGGNDSLFLLGQNDGGTNTYAFPAFNQFRFGDISTGKIITFSDIEQATLRSGIGGDTIDVDTASIPLSIISGAGNDAVTVSARTAVVTVDTGPEQSVPLDFRGGDILSVGFVSTFPASVVVEQTDTVLGLSVIAASTLRLTNGAVLNRVAPFIDFGLSLSGTIDLGDGALLWRASGSTPDFRAFLTRGRNNGSWNGTNASINSSLAAASTVSDGVGYGLGSEVAINSIGPFAIQPGDMLLRYTLDGDADLDQQVNLNDFNRLASNFGTAGAVWARGDFDYDGAVNLADFNALAGNFGQSLGTTRTCHGPGRGGAARDEDVGLRLQELS